MSATEERARRGRSSDGPVQTTTGEDVAATLAELADAKARYAAAVRVADEPDYRDTYAIATAQSAEALFLAEVGYWPCDCPERCSCGFATAAKMTKWRGAT